MQENSAEELPQLEAVQEDFKTKNKVYELLLYAGPQLEQFPKSQRRLAADPNYMRDKKPCLPMKKYEQMSKMINEIGCMIGGYYKSLNGNPAAQAAGKQKKR